MAIEVKVTKELGNFEPKLLGPFTARQCLCLLVAGPLSVMIYNYMSNSSLRDYAFIPIVPIAAIAGLVGWYKPYGMPFEKFVKSIFINVIVAPQKRKYITENTHEELMNYVKQIEQKEQAEMLEMEKQKDKSSFWKRKPKKKKEKKAKYKLSKEAIK